MRRMLAPGPGEPVLDLGCGAGKLALYAARAGARAAGVDVAPFFLASAAAEVDLVMGDLRRLPFRKGAFPAAYSLDVLEHLDEAGVREVLLEARRVVGPRRPPLRLHPRHGVVVAGLLPARGQPPGAAPRSGRARRPRARGPAQERPPQRDPEPRALRGPLRLRGPAGGGAAVLQRGGRRRWSRTWSCGSTSRRRRRRRAAADRGRARARRRARERPPGGRASPVAPRARGRARAHLDPEARRRALRRRPDRTLLRTARSRGEDPLRGLGPGGARADRRQRPRPRGGSRPGRAGARGPRGRAGTRARRTSRAFRPSHGTACAGRRRIGSSASAPGPPWSGSPTSCGRTS